MYLRNSVSRSQLSTTFFAVPGSTLSYPLRREGWGIGPACASIATKSSGCWISRSADSSFCRGDTSWTVSGSSFWVGGNLRRLPLKIWMVQSSLCGKNRKGHDGIPKVVANRLPVLCQGLCSTPPVCCGTLRIEIENTAGTSGKSATRGT